MQRDMRRGVLWSMEWLMESFVLLPERFFFVQFNKLESEKCLCEFYHFIVIFLLWCVVVVFVVGICTI